MLFKGGGLQCLSIGHTWLPNLRKRQDRLSAGNHKLML
jgi:hypothetical protein